MNGSMVEAFNLKAPRLGSVAVISVGTSSARTNLADTAQLGSAAESGRLVTLIADADCYIAFNNADSGTVDETATTGATACMLLPAKLPVTVQLTGGYTWLLHKAGSATLVRAFVSSFNFCG